MLRLTINKTKLMKLLKSYPIVSMDCHYCPIPKKQKQVCAKRLFKSDYCTGGKECPGIILRWMIK